MISRIRGTLAQIDDGHALVENGGVSYEVMLPSALADRLKDNDRVGKEIVFETIYYIEAGDKKSAHYPKLVGFDDAVEREFFSLYLHVPGLGIKKALKSLVLPIRDIASAIETKDASQLSRLPGVGSRLADKIIAELNGKTTKFALSRKSEPLARKDKKPAEPFVDDALEVLQQLQYKSVEARDMIDKALQEHPKVKSVEALLDIIFRNQNQEGSP
jgi:Holliday junction DNA helicase RuvA